MSEEVISSGFHFLHAHEKPSNEVNLASNVLEASSSSSNVLEASSSSSLSSFSFLQANHNNNIIDDNVEESESDVIASSSSMNVLEASSMNVLEASSMNVLEASSMNVLEASSSSSSSSGFSFLSQESHNSYSNPSSMSAAQIEDSEEPSRSLSRFSFMSSSSSSSSSPSNLHTNSHLNTNSIGNEESGSDLLSHSMVSPAQDIKLAKVAQAKQVKKKKKASRVGFGRDDEVDDLESNQSAQETISNLPPIPPTKLQEPVIRPVAPPDIVVIPDTVPLQEKAESVEVGNVPAQAEVTKQHHHTSSAPEQSHSASVHATASPSHHASTTSAPAPPVSKRGSFFDYFTGRKDAPAPSPSPAPAPTSAPAAHVSPAYPVPQAPVAPPPAAVPHVHHEVHRAQPEHLIPSPPATQPPIPERRPSMQEPPAPPPSYKPESPPRTPQTTRKHVNDSQTHAHAHAPAHVHNHGHTHAPVPPAPATPPPAVVSHPPIAHASPSPRAPAPAPASVKMESAVDKLMRESEAIGQEFSSRADTLCAAHKRHQLTLATLRKRVASLHADVIKLKLHLIELDAEQQRLAQIEEYEQADAITTGIGNLKTQLASKEQEVESLRDEELILSSQLARHRPELCALLESSASAVLTLKQQQEDEAEQLRAKSEKELTAVAARLAGEEERVTMERTHLSKEEQVVEEESRTTEAAISSQCGHLQTERDAAQATLSDLQAEIFALEAQLASKRSESKKVKHTIDDLDDQISDVRRKYERPLQRIVDRQHALKKALVECAKEEAVFQQQRQFYESQKAAALDAHSRVRRWCGLVEALANNAQLVQTTFSQSIADLTNDSAENNNSNITSLREAVVSAEVALAGVQQAQAAVSAKLNQLAEEAADIDRRIPILESEKKDHATAKRFKEAAAVSKESKTLAARKEEIELEVASASASSAENGTVLQAAEARLSAAATALRDAQKEGCVLQYKSYQVRIKELRRVLATITTASSNAVSAVSGGAGGMQTFRVVVESLVEDELSGLLEESTRIKTEYSLPDELDTGGSDEPATEDVPQAAVDEPVQSTAESELPTETQPDTEAELQTSETTATLSEEERNALLDSSRELIARRRDLSAQMDIAAAEEDFEKAAELDESVAALSTEIAALARSLGVTVEELEQ